MKKFIKSLSVRDGLFAAAGAVVVKAVPPAYGWLVKFFHKEEKKMDSHKPKAA